VRDFFKVGAGKLPNWVKLITFTSMTQQVKIIECPRDAMQGLHAFIPTDQKVAYLQELLAVGFHTLDCGSFVSPAAIPQMRDTAEVLAKLDLSKSTTQLLTIVANERGAQEACLHASVQYLGFPLSASETFQQRNTNRSVKEAFQTIDVLQLLAQKHHKELVVYISMGFGNPYGDPYSVEIVESFAGQLVQRGVRIISLADTVGTADLATITYLFQGLIQAFPEVEFGAHFHARPEEAPAKIKAAYAAGCRRFDSAMRGFGGCPMAKDELVGNTATEVLLDVLMQEGEELGLNQSSFSQSLESAGRLFAKYR
jgi:hydroxymethylglutaryl-CoA lyase